MEDLRKFYDNLELVDELSGGPCSKRRFSPQKNSFESKKDLVIIDECINHSRFKTCYGATLLSGARLVISTVNREASWEDIDSFMREAQVMGGLSHPNIIDVFDKGIDPLFGPYIAMPFVEGCSLSEYLKGSPSEEELLAILVQLCRVVSFIHNRDVLHCKLRPENFLVSSEGNLYLTGWSDAIALPSLDMSLSKKSLLNQIYVSSGQREKLYKNELKNFAALFRAIAIHLPKGRRRSLMLEAVCIFSRTTDTYPIRKLLKIAESIVCMDKREPLSYLKYGFAAVASLLLIFADMTSNMQSDSGKEKVSYILKSESSSK